MKKSSSSDRSGSSPPSACCPRMGNPCALAAGRLISWLRSLSAPARRSRAWPGTVVEGAALSVHVAALSKALGDGSAGKRYIATLSGRGYALIAPVTGENAKSAAGCFAQAAEMAHEQGALFWELRVALSLARLLRGHGRSADAMGILRPVYDRFTEGFNTADLREAKNLLEELA